jgi:hypothetical protein
MWKEPIGPNLKYYPVELDELRKTTNNLRQNSRYPGRVLNPGPSEYEAEVLTTQPQHSVGVDKRGNIKLDLKV